MRGIVANYLGDVWMGLALNNHCHFRYDIDRVKSQNEEVSKWKVKNENWGTPITLTRV